MCYLLTIKFFVLIYRFSGKVLVNLAIPKLPLLTKCHYGSNTANFFFCNFFFKNILKGGKKDDFDIYDVEFPMSKFALHSNFNV